LRYRGGELVAWHGLGEQVALDIVTAEVVKNGKLIVPFDAFGDRRKPERSAQVDNAANNCCALCVLGDSVDEGFVDLDHVDREVAQVAE